jgi:NAD(P)-dependent dehydrogenase (short-subunit alcohol dehydrogenase family)
MLSSAGHRFCDVDIEDPGFAHTPYNPWIAYGRSKTANILFAVEFDRRQRARGVRAIAVHPGAIPTELGRHLTPEVRAAMPALTPPGSQSAPPMRWKSIPQGAATSVWAAVVADVDAAGGLYAADCQVAEITHEEGLPGGVRSYAVDPERAKALWAKSEEMVGEKF